MKLPLEDRERTGIPDRHQTGDGAREPEGKHLEGRFPYLWGGEEIRKLIRSYHAAVAAAPAAVSMQSTVTGPQSQLVAEVTR